MAAPFLRSAACGALLLLAVPAAAAPAPDAVATMLTDAVAATGEATLTYDSVAGSGDTVTLSGVKIASASGSAVTIPALVITGAAEREPGGFTATAIAFDKGNATGHGETTTWDTASIADAVVPSADEVKQHARVRPFARIAATGLSVASANLAAPIDIATAEADIGDVAANAPANILMRATGVRLQTALLASTAATAIAGMLDYKEVLADVTLDSEYDANADTVTVHQLAIDVPDVGKITIAGKASGLSLGGLADKTRAKEARAAAQLDNLSVRVDNAGFVERMLDVQAQLLGGTRDDVRSQLVDGALPFALSFVKNASFRDQFQAAMETFLKDPHSFTITFAPAKPVPLGEVMRTAAHKPGGLPDLLTPSVEANN